MSVRMIVLVEALVEQKFAIVGQDSQEQIVHKWYFESKKINKQYINLKIVFFFFYTYYKIIDFFTITINLLRYFLE